MGEHNVRETKRERFVNNKWAFDDVFGDPFAVPEPTNGHYQTLKSRGAVAAMKNNFDEGKATRNPAAPNIMDFFCDVEKVVNDNLTPDEVRKFVNTYFYEKPDGEFNQKERTDVEQRLGRVLRAKKISPVRRYFTTIRGRIAKCKQSKQPTK